MGKLHRKIIPLIDQQDNMLPPKGALWNCKKIPWKSLGISDQKQQIALWKTAAMHDGTISDYADFFSRMQKSVLSSAIVADIDGTVIRVQSQTGIGDIRTLSDPEYLHRLELMSLFVTSGFPLFFVTAGSHRAQMKKVIKPLLQMARERGVEESMNGVGVFSDSVTRFFTVENGVMHEDTDYSTLTRFKPGLSEEVIDVSSRVVAKFRDEARKVEAPGFKPLPPVVSLEQPGKIVISPFPSWRHDVSLYHHDPEQRIDVRSRVVRALRSAFAENKRLHDVAVLEGGTTSIDITLKHVHKGFALQYLLNKVPERCHLTYMGDEVYPGGNDMPVAHMLSSRHFSASSSRQLSVMALNRVPQSVPMNIKGVFPVGTTDFFSTSVFQMYLLVLKNIINYGTLGDVGSIGPIVARTFENLTRETILHNE